MGISLFVQDLGAFPAERARQLDARMRSEVGRGIDCVYALVWPDYQPPASPVPQANRRVFRVWRRDAGVPLWGWLNAQRDQEQDAVALKALTAELSPEGWLLDIEGEWTKGAKLLTLLAGAAGTGRPVRASLAGASPAHVEYDWRQLDRLDIPVDWQSYMDSGEGCWPATAVAELYRSSFVIGGWEYRHHMRGNYGWCKVGRVASGVAKIDSYLQPRAENADLKVRAAEWGWRPVDGRLIQGADTVGLMMGRCRYANARVTLDVTRGHDMARSLAGWTAVAASARIEGSVKRPVSVYTAEATSDDVLVAIAAGAP